ncbi:hypothetical protein JL722_13782 [Aureococcus anophagefferens]|nr:hypothetical protein JL722_13782 [Aureococcus anophagefferens]
MYDVLVPSTKRDPREKKILYEIRVISEERCGRFEVKDRASKAWSVWKRWAECRKLSEALKSGVVVAGGLPFPEHAKQAVLTLGKGSEKRQAELEGLESRNAVGVVVSSAFDQATKSASVVVAFNAPARFVADVSELVAQDDDDAEADLVGRILNAHNDYEGLAYAKYKPHKPFKTTESSKAQSPRLPNESFTYVSTRTGAKTTYTYTTETEDYSTPAPEPPKSSSWLCAYPQADDATLTDEDEQIPIQRYPDAAGDGYEDDMFNIMLCNSSTVEAH